MGTSNKGVGDLDTATLKSHIKQGKFDKFYIFTGPELFVRSAYIQQISKVRDITPRTFETFSEISRYANTLSLLQKSSIYVIIDDMSILSDDSLQSVLERSDTFRNDTIIFVFNVLDKRNKFYKRFKDHVIEFEYLQSSILRGYIKKDLKLSDRGCDYLIDVCEQDYSRIRLEIDKILNFSKITGRTDYDKILVEFLNNGTIYVPPKDAIFDFVDAVLKKKKKLAYELLEDCKDIGEPSLVILSVMFSNAKQTLQVQSYTGSAKITDVAGITPFQAKLASARKDIYTDEQLVNLMTIVRDAEVGIKSGSVEEPIAVEYVLARFW